MPVITSQPFNQTPVGAVDTSPCDQEPIQYADAIQPHGALVIVEEPTLRIVQYSANLAAFLGLAGPVGHGQFLAQWLGETHTQALHAALADRSLDQAYVHLLTLHGLGQADASFHVFANRSDGLLLLEFEAVIAEAETRAAASLQPLNQALITLRQASTLEQFLAMACDLVRACSGFERIMFYRFSEDGNGAVIAESLEPGLALEPYLGLHFPASDIPRPARRLFERCDIRCVPDVDYEPVPLCPGFGEAGLAHPVDLGFSALRSASPMCRMYKRNMEVKSTLILPLRVDRRLWGLVSCMHHSAPRQLSYPERSALVLLARLTTLWLTEYEDSDYRHHCSRLAASLARHKHELDLMHQAISAETLASLNLLDGVRANGVAILLDGSTILQGLTPPESEVRRLLRWLQEQKQSLYASDHLLKDYPAAAGFTEIAGLLAIVLSKTSESGIFWFRQEYLQEVNWAGNPVKPVVTAADGTMQVHPRASFARWREIARGRSSQWLDCETDYAWKLRRAVSDRLLQRLQLIETLYNPADDLRPERESFLYSAAHDLKEPLRGIRNYTQLIRMEEGNQLDPRNRQRMETVIALTGKMDQTIQSLLRFAKTEQEGLILAAHDIGPIAREAAQTLVQAHPTLDIEVAVQADFPVITCDATQVQTVFEVLISNAIQYNASPRRLIGIGYFLQGEVPVFFVRDNGTGIAPDYHETIFELFRRLPESLNYGGGSGAGLAIARQAVQRHGGALWLESAPGQGSCFFFSLAAGIPDPNP